MKPIVIMPTYNERDNIKVLIRAVLDVDPALHVLVVDDNSPDGTGDLARQLARETGRVELLPRAGKMGLGSAYKAGFAYALARGYSHMVEMDADGSHRPEDLGRLLAAAERADVVIGSRNVPGGRTEGWTWPRQVISKGGSLYARTILRLKIKDCTSGYKCFRREVLDTLDLASVQSNGFGFQVEMNYLCQQAGFTVTEVPIIFPDRRQGRSKMSSRIFLEALLLVWRLRLRPAPPLLPIRIDSRRGHAADAVPPAAFPLELPRVLKNVAFSGLSEKEEGYRSAKQGEIVKPNPRTDLPRKVIADDMSPDGWPEMKGAV